jgi:hypothetical protein
VFLFFSYSAHFGDPCSPPSSPELSSLLLRSSFQGFTGPEGWSKRGL